MNNTAMNALIDAFWGTYISISVRYIPRRGSLGHRVCSALTETTEQFSKVVVLIYFLTSNV